MFIALYTVFLVLASGLSGVYAHALLADQGYISTFDSAATLTIGVAALFACAQLAYMTLLQLVAPTRSGGPFVTEAASNAAAVLLLPYIARLPLPMPHPKLAEFDFLVLAGVFGGVHVAIKLLSLFAALHSRPTTRLVLLFWGGCTVASGMFAATELKLFADGLIEARQTLLPEASVTSVDRVYAEARPLAEGTLFRIPVEGLTGKSVMTYFSVPATESDPPDRVWIAVDINGSSNRPYVKELPLHPSGWTSFRVPPEQIPADATYCDLIWMREEEASWMTQTRIRPAVYGGSSLLVSGPYFPAQRTAESPKSMVVILADGIPASHTAFASYERTTTPELGQWADRALRAEECMTPAPETPAALMTVLTGVSPLRHGYMNGHPGRLPADYLTLPEILSQQGYICAAFTEGESTAGEQTAVSDIVHGSGYERGFHLFDQAFPMAPAVLIDGNPLPGSFAPAGAATTLERVQQFIEDHRDTNHFVLVRLRELAYPRIIPGRTAGFVSSGNPKDTDVYDAALINFDTEVGAFLQWLESGQAATNTVVVFASTYGYDFPGGKRGVYLNEPCLHVPLIIRADANKARTLRTPCSLEDLTPTLAAIGGVRFPQNLPGIDLFGTITSREPISVTGNPVALSLRTRNWRLTWQSGRDPETRAEVEREEFIEFISLPDYFAGRPQQNNWSRESDLAGRYRQRLLDYLLSQKPLAEVASGS